MIFIFEFFSVAFLLMSIFVGAGLVILAYFGLAPRPVWMQKHINKQARAEVLPSVTWLQIDVKASSKGAWAAPAYSVGVTLATLVIGLVTSTSIEQRLSIRVRETVETHDSQKLCLPPSYIFLNELNIV